MVDTFKPLSAGFIAVREYQDLYYWMAEIVRRSVGAYGTVI